MKKQVILIFSIIILILLTGASTRNEFNHWITEYNGLTTRQNILIRDAVYLDSRSTAVVIDGNIIAGVWECPYTGLLFVDPKDMDVDHIVSLDYAYTHGASEWTPALRQQFANDHDNLIAVYDVENRKKSNKGPSNYLPPQKAFQAIFMRKFIQICTEYPLNCDKVDLEVKVDE